MSNPPFQTNTYFFRIAFNNNLKNNRILVATLLISTLLSLATLNANSQDFSGRVFNINTGIGLENATVKARQNKDGAVEKTATTGIDGSYEIFNVITAINNNHPFADDNITINYNGDQIEALLKSKIKPEWGKVIDINGRTIANNSFEPTGDFNEYKAIFDINGLATGSYFLSDGIHPIVRLLSGLAPHLGKQKKEFVKEKSALTEPKEVILETDDDPTIDAFQPRIDTVNIMEGDVINLALKKWQEYSSNLYFHVKDSMEGGVNLAQIDVKSLNGPLMAYTKMTNMQGKTSLYGLPLGHIPGNKGIPDSIDWKVTVSHDNFKTLIDTIWKASAGDTYKELTLLPKEEQASFYANLYTKAFNSKNGDRVADAIAKLWELGTADTLKQITNAQGEANFLNIEKKKR